VTTGYPFLDDDGPVLAFAHRGGARHPDLVGLENTRAAFAHAVALGYSYLETDVHVTRDGVLVAFHDALLERVTDGAGTLEQLDAADLARVRVGGREPVPTLAELVTWFPDARFNIDLKSDAAVDLLADLVERTGVHDRVCVGSFSERRLQAFRRAVSRPVATSYGPIGVGLSRFAPRRLARRVLDSRGEALQVPAHRGALAIVTAELVERAHAAGRPVHVWVVDEPDEMRRLLDLGVDGLMTDDLVALRDVLRERGHWPT